RQTVHARDERVTRLEESHSSGLGVRVLAGGAWGFAASALRDEREVERVTALALEIARGSATLRARQVALAAEPVVRTRYRSPRRIDPFGVPLAEKAELALGVNALLRAEPEIGVAECGLGAWQRLQHFASTEGARIATDLVRTWGQARASAVGAGDSQTRSLAVNPRHAGWEHVVAADLPGHAAQLAREAREKLHARPGPVGELDLILDPLHLCLTIHETCGHPSELDRALGWEANFAGTSFLTPDQLGTLRYGSPAVSLVADNTLPVGLASTGFDDEGVAGQRWDIVRDGLFVGYSTSREVAGAIDEPRSRGSARADSWASVPIVRIANVGLEPGDATLDELVADTRDGILIQGMGTYSIDQRRLNFQFGGDRFTRIENGRLTEPLQRVTYQGTTPEFWNACDGVCDRAHWEPNGVLTCGKGEPMQYGQMTHGAAHARFRRVRVGSAK
nr:TldD/PmbA family protein [Myxococcota bacterium]